MKRRQQDRIEVTAWEWILTAGYLMLIAALVFLFVWGAIFLAVQL